MKVYFVDPNNTTAQVNYPLAESISALHVDLTYFTSINRWDTAYYEKEYNVKSRHIFFRLANKIKHQPLRQVLKGFSYPFNIFHLFLRIILNPPELIHLNNITIPFIDYCFISLIKLLSIPVILTQHNFKEHDKENISNWKIKSYKKVNTIICLSEFTKSQFPKIFQPKIASVKHGNVYEKEIAKYRKEQDVLPDNEKLKILFFGIIRPYKGIELLIDAFHLVQDTVQIEIELKIIGNVIDPNYFNELIKKISNHKSIIIENKFLEYKDIINEIEQASIGVLPYISATQSGIPYIYTSLFKPMVVTNVGALSEQVSIQFTELCNPNSIEIAEALIRMVEKIIHKKISKELFADFNNENSWEKVCNEYFNIYLKNIRN